MVCVRVTNDWANTVASRQLVSNFLRHSRPHAINNGNRNSKGRTKNVLHGNYSILVVIDSHRTKSILTRCCQRFTRAMRTPGKWNSAKIVYCRNALNPRSAFFFSLSIDHASEFVDLIIRSNDDSSDSLRTTLLGPAISPLLIGC